MVACERCVPTENSDGRHPRAVEGRAIRQIPIIPLSYPIRGKVSWASSAPSKDWNLNLRKSAQSRLNLRKLLHAAVTEFAISYSFVSDL